MALSCYAGTFAEKLTTGTQGYTGFGFQPKAVIFFGEGKRTASGTAAEARQYVGFATSGSDMTCSGWYADDGPSVSVTSRWNVSTSCVRYQTDATVNCEATLSSFDADGVTLNYSAVSGAAVLHGVMALGGADLTGQKAGSFATAGATGNLPVTGVGFQPDCVIFTTSRGSGSNACFAVGWMNANGEQGAMSLTDRDAQGTSDAYRYERSDKALVSLDTAGALGTEATFVSMDSDGFTLNFTTDGTAMSIRYLALKGCQTAIGAFLWAGATGVSNLVSGLAFQPVGACFLSDNNTASTSIVPHARCSFGAVGNTVTADAAVWAGSSDASANAVSDSGITDSACFRAYTEGTPTEIARFAIDAYTSDGMDANWAVTTAGARGLYLAFGNAAGGGGRTTKNTRAWPLGTEIGMGWGMPA